MPQTDLEVCGEADDADDAVALVRVTKPDFVLVDLNRQSGHGLDLIKQIKAHDDRVKMLGVTMWEESLYAERAFRG